MNVYNRVIGNYIFSFEPPLDPRTDDLDLVDAVSLQHHMNISLDMGDEYFTNPFILTSRNRTEARVGSILFDVIDGIVPSKRPSSEKEKIQVLQGYLGDLTDRAVTVTYCNDLSDLTA